MQRATARPILGFPASMIKKGHSYAPEGTLDKRGLYVLHCTLRGIIPSEEHIEVLTEKYEATHKRRSRGKEKEKATKRAKVVK